MYIDTHCHLLDSRFDKDREGAILRLFEAKVELLIEISCEIEKWKSAIDFACVNPHIYVAVGIHPQDAKTASEKSFIELENIAKSDKVAAIGETGLDYYYENSPRDVQQDVFMRHIDLSVNINKPLVIHCRDAYKDLIAILNAQTKLPKGVIHCFSGTPDDAKQLIDLGFYIGIDGPVTYPNAKILRKTVENMPLEKFLLETDSPYLPPQARRGERNEPCYLPLIAEEISKIKNISIEKVSQVTTENARRLFNIT